MAKKEKEEPMKAVEFQQTVLNPAIEAINKATDKKGEIEAGKAALQKLDELNKMRKAEDVEPLDLPTLEPYRNMEIPEDPEPEEAETEEK